MSDGSVTFEALPAILNLWIATETTPPKILGAVAPLGRRVIANNGMAVFVKDGAVMLASRDGVLTTANTSTPSSSAIIESQGRFVVYGTASSPHQLDLYDLTEGREFPLVQADEGCAQPALSDDGRLMLFLSAANLEAKNYGLRIQAWLFDFNTGILRQLTQDPASLTEATLSGDGRIVSAVTLAGRPPPRHHRRPNRDRGRWPNGSRCRWWL